jgi:hypothetical protein
LPPRRHRCGRAPPTQRQVVVVGVATAATPHVASGIGDRVGSPDDDDIGNRGRRRSS